jgi:hypothetical protein
MQNRGCKLCQAIVGHPKVRGHLSKGMWIAVIHHTEMAELLATLQTVVSSAAQFMLGRSPTEVFRVEVVDELFTEFREQEERRLLLEKSGARVYDLILGPLSGRARLDNLLEEAIGYLWVEQVARYEANGELEAMCSSVARVRDLVLEGPSGMSSLTVSLSSAIELIGDHVDATTTNGVC